MSLSFIASSKGNLFPLVVLLSGAAGVILLNGVEVEGRIQCYVCSWQKPTKNFSVADNCTHHNFNPEYASIVNCSSNGCEAVTYRHSKNEDVYHFNRNCLNSKSGRNVDSCNNFEDKFEYTTRCECHSDLCNSSPKSKTLSWNTVGATAIIILMQLHNRN